LLIPGFVAGIIAGGGLVLLIVAVVVIVFVVVKRKKDIPGSQRLKTSSFYELNKRDVSRLLFANNNPPMTREEEKFF